MTLTTKQLAYVTLLLAAVAAGQLSAQTWDISGNSQLNGTYYFREVAWQVSDNVGNVGQGIAVYGTMTFDGNGHYTITSSQVSDSNVSGGQPCSNCAGYPTSGTYSIGMSSGIRYRFPCGTATSRPKPPSSSTPSSRSERQQLICPRRQAGHA